MGTQRRTPAPVQTNEVVSVSILKILLGHYSKYQNDMMSTGKIKWAASFTPVLTQCRWAPAWCREEDWWARRTACSGGRSSRLEKETEETFRAALEPSLAPLHHYTVHQPGNEPSNHREKKKYEPPLFSTFQWGQRQNNPHTESERVGGETVKPVVGTLFPSSRCLSKKCLLQLLTITIERF